MPVGLHVPTNFQIYQQNSEKALGGLPPGYASGYTLANVIRNFQAVISQSDTCYHGIRQLNQLLFYSQSQKLFL